MSAAELIIQLRHMTNPDRLAVIEAATRLIREDLLGRTGRDDRLRAAAESVKDLYEPGGELTEWTSLDAEEILDDSHPR